MNFVEMGDGLIQLAILTVGYIWYMTYIFSSISPSIVALYGSMVIGLILFLHVCTSFPLAFLRVLL